MRPSPKRHVLALLRLFLGLHQQEMADAVGCSRELIQSIELKRAPLTDEMAMKVSKATGINLTWLLRNDLSAPMVAATGNPYMKYHFERAQAVKSAPLDERSIEAVPSYLLSYYVRLRAVFASAGKTGESNLQMAFYKLDKAIEELRNEFGFEPTIDPERKQGAKVRSSELDFVERDLNKAKEAFENFRNPPE